MNTTEQKPGWDQQFLSWFRFIMASCYILIGLLVLAGQGSLFSNMTDNYRYLFSGILIAYGSYRLWMIYRQYTNE